MNKTSLLAALLLSTACLASIPDAAAQGRVRGRAEHLGDALVRVVGREQRLAQPRDPVGHGPTLGPGR